jgi:hypothetical protein
VKTFQDNAGQTWSLAINVAAVKRVKDLLRIDLLSVLDGKLLEELAGDPVKLCDVVYVLCKPEADTKGITDEQFGQAMAGDALEHATTAFLEELVSFFPQGRRAVLSRTLAKLRQLESRVLDHVTTTLDSDRIDRAMEAELARVDRDIDARLAAIGDSSGSLPASSASIPPD